MAREEQRKLRELNKALPKILRKKIKAYPFKKKDFMIWYSKKDLFFDLLITVNVTADGHCFCTSRETVKLFAILIFLSLIIEWQLFGMHRRLLKYYTVFAGKMKYLFLYFFLLIFCKFTVPIRKEAAITRIWKGIGQFRSRALQQGIENPLTSICTLWRRTRPSRRPQGRKFTKES